MQACQRQLDFSLDCCDVHGVIGAVSLTDTTVGSGRGYPLSCVSMEGTEKTREELQTDMLVTALSKLMWETVNEVRLRELIIGIEGNKSQIDSGELLESLIGVREALGWQGLDDSQLVAVKEKLGSTNKIIRHFSNLPSCASALVGINKGQAEVAADAQKRGTSALMVKQLATPQTQQLLEHGAHWPPELSHALFRVMKTHWSFV